MNCDQFANLIGMRCEPQPTRDGSPCVAVVTPFNFFDGDGLSIFAFGTGDKVLLSDEGQTLSWLHGLGHRGLDDRRVWKPLRSALGHYGVTLDDDGTIEILAPLNRAPAAFAHLVSGLLAIDAWARDAANVPAPLLLKEEAALHLRAWRPGVPVEIDPAPILGMSGAAHTFALQQGSEFIDVIGPSQASSAAEARKLLDIRSSARNAALDIRVIVDDRRHPERAGTEIAILGRLARAWPMSRLIRASGQSGNH